MIPFMGVVECISPAMCGSQRWIIRTQVHWWISYIRAVRYVCGRLLDIWQCLWHPEPFHVFRIGCSAKTFNGWLPLNVFAGWLCPTCVTAAWVPSWIEVILIWYHYIVICTLVTILNWWLSSKDTKLQGLIKEVLIVFHWLSFALHLFIYLLYIFGILEGATQYLLTCFSLVKYIIFLLFLNILMHINIHIKVNM